MGMQDHLKLMTENGLLDDRRLSRYRNRVSELIRVRLEDAFWTVEKRSLLDKLTQSLSSIKTAPVILAQQLLDRQQDEF
jgi:putative protein kinase ArgK-like GTPase of G3E family